MNRAQLLSELRFKAVRSSGAGGQHVNKVASKVIAEWSPTESAALSDEQKALVMQRLSSRLNKNGILSLRAEGSRSQFKNKDEVTARMLNLVEAALHVEKPRKPTKVPKSVVEKRLREKQLMAKTKQLRKRPDF